MTAGAQRRSTYGDLAGGLRNFRVRPRRLAASLDPIAWNRHPGRTAPSMYRAARLQAAGLEQPWRGGAIAGFAEINLIRNWILDGAYRN